MVLTFLLSREFLHNYFSLFNYIRSKFSSFVRTFQHVDTMFWVYKTSIQRLEIAKNSIWYYQIIDNLYQMHMICECPIFIPVHDMDKCSGVMSLLLSCPLIEILLNKRHKLWRIISRPVLLVLRPDTLWSLCSSIEECMSVRTSQCR